MKITDKGVIDPSFMDFSLPSTFAKKALYYTPQFGHFYYTSDYRVERDTLELYLLLYICHGSLFVKTRGHQVIAEAGQIVLLDCHYPHIYGCQTAGDFLWFHFSGNSSHDYTEHLYEQNGLLFSGDQIPLLQVNFNNILSSAQHAIVNEPQISLNVDKLLSTLAAPESSSALANQILSPALEHIRKGFAEPLNLDELAGLCSISTSYFIRCFKKYLNCTPHEYLLLYRLRQAKNLLLSTPDSVEGIADTCGFNSPSHFARAFKKVNQMTPSEFRALHF